MKLRSLEVEQFGCIERARVDFGPGLNVLYGPNDLGKSTLAQALRAVLLLPHASSFATSFVPWDTDEVPRVELTFEAADGRVRRVEKCFAGDSRGRSGLWESNDGTNFRSVTKGRDVDHELRELLGWGVATPGGRGAPRGLPSSFLATVLLGEQADVVGVLTQAIEKDSDDTGRARLTAALEAFAQDPLFKKILEQAQRRVDEAFSKTGQKKRSADSPFREAADEVRRVRELLDGHAARVRETEVAEQELEARRRLVTARLDEREAAHAELESLRALRARWAEHDALLAELNSAKVEWTRLEDERNGLREREEQLQALRVRVDQGRARQQELGEAAERARAALSEAEEVVRRAQSDEAEQRRRLAHAELEKRELLLGSRATELEARATATARAQQQAQRLAEAHARLEALRVEGEAQAARARGAEEQAAALAADLELVELARRVVARDRSRAEVERIEALAGQARALRAEAEELRRRAAAREEVRPRDLPDETTLDALEALGRSLELAEARLGGGLSVAIERPSPVTIAAVADGADVDLPERGDARFEADRAVTLCVGDTTITISAGERAAREAAERLRARWSGEARPVLARAGVTDLVALRARVEADRVVAEEIAAAREQALGKEQHAALREEQTAGLAEARARLAAAGVGLEDIGEAVARFVEQAGASALDQQAERLRAQQAEAAATAKSARDALRDGESERLRVEERVTAAREALEELGASAPDDGWDAELERLRRERDAVQRDLATLHAERAGLEASATAEAEAATRARDEAAARVDAAARALEEAQARLTGLLDQTSSLAGKVEDQRERVSSLDFEGAAAAVEELSRRLAALPEPARRVDDDAVARATEAAERADRELDAARGELRKAEGALEQVGGEVARDEARAAREALTRAESREREVELEYEAWRLLVETLRDAENTEGQHLGEALSQPVSRRFAELTGGRYGKLMVGPDLKADGLRVAGELRDIGALSLGTQEQLATLLRLTVAEHLKTMLVLDDHLAQTDAIRGAWFRDLLRDHAQHTQVIVLTCRPSEYSAAGARVLDLGGVIRRVGAPPA